MILKIHRLLYFSFYSVVFNTDRDIYNLTKTLFYKTYILHTKLFVHSVSLLLKEFVPVTAFRNLADGDITFNLYA